MGRKKGSKNKPKINVEVLADNTEIKDISPDNGIKQELSTSTPIKRGRGRPKGAKGKPKEIKETSDNIRRIKKEIKDLIAEKRLILKTDKDKRYLLRQRIKDLKLSLIEKKEVKTQIDQVYNDPAKIELIAEILRIDPLMGKIEINLNKYTAEQLQKHIECVKRRGLI